LIEVKTYATLEAAEVEVRAPNVKTTENTMFSFDGMKRTCKRFAKAKGGVYRCADFENRKGHPSHCPAGMVSRSPGLIHLSLCDKAGARKATSRKTKRHGRRGGRRSAKK
jgi:hypothetical protein